MRMRSAFLLLTLLIGVQAFHILKKPNSKNHQDITRSAIVRATAKLCETVEGFKKPEPLNAETLAKACKKDAFKSNFETGIIIIAYYNVKTDLDHPFSEKHHFDSERFLDGKALIIEGIENIKAHVKKEKFEDARKTLGAILHTLQDFYSHSNWIELGNTEPCTALINPDENIPNPAEKEQPTCKANCANENCGATILQDIIDKKILTSGHFGVKKPPGKCSHGGTLDFTTGTGRSWDGINKDYRDSSHGLLHNKAAEVAIKASVQLLEKIWKNNDDAIFFRLMGLHQEKPKGEWKTHIPFISFKDRFPNATENENVEIE